MRARLSIFRMASKLVRRNWLNAHPKHLFILTSAGKPVFSLHEDDGSGSMLAILAMIRALVAKVDDELEMVEGANGFRLVALRRSDLLLVCVQHNAISGLQEDREPLKLVQNQLELLYLHILFHVTKPALESILTKSASYDVASLLGGTDVEARNLINRSEVELSLSFEAIPVVSIGFDQRLKILEALEVARDQLGTFAILMTINGHLLGAVGPKYRRGRFGPMLSSARDMLLLSNLVQSNPQLKVTESWAPLCMPDYDSSGHFQSYCASVAEDLFFVLLTTDISLETFKEASKRREILKETLAPDISIYYASKISPSDLSGSVTSALHLGIRAIRDDVPQFVESNQTPQSSPIEDIFSIPQRRYIARRYCQARSGLSTQGKLLYHMGVRDNLVFYREPNLEMFGLFPPFTPEAEIVDTFTKLKTQATKSKNSLFCSPSSYY